MPLRGHRCIKARRFCHIIWFCTKCYSFRSYKKL